MSARYTENDDLTALLVGRSVVSVEGNRALLDSGTELEFVGNDGGCICGAGVYDLTHLAAVPNLITRVETDDSPASDDTDDDGEGYYRIYVWAADQKILLAEFEGTDGNGYYGTGYTITARQRKGGDDQ